MVHFPCINRIVFSLSSIGLRLLDIGRQFPRRWRRFVSFLGGASTVWPLKDNPLPFPWRFLEGLLLFLDCWGLGEILEIMNAIVKPNSRALTEAEKALASEVFGKSINWKRVRLDEWALLGPPQKQFCYVGFYVINSWRKMSPTTLIHELVHVWQFQQVGSSYIARALWAQQQREAYNYGGYAALEIAYKEERGLLAFNFEQQADIIADAFSFKKSLPMRWTPYQHDIDPKVFEYFLQLVQSGRLY